MHCFKFTHFFSSSGWINFHPCPWVWKFSQFIISSPLGIIRCHFPPKLMDMKWYSIFICLYFLSGLLMLNRWFHIFMTIRVSSLVNCSFVSLAHFSYHHHHQQLLSRVSLFVAPWTEAHQAPLSTEFSRQEYCSGLRLLLLFLTYF